MGAAPRPPPPECRRDPGAPVLAIFEIRGADLGRRVSAACRAPPRPAGAGAVSDALLSAGTTCLATISMGMKYGCSGPSVPVVLPPGFRPHSARWLAT